MRFLTLLALATGCGQETSLTNLVGQDGQIRFNLQFDNADAVDLDLHVVTPNLEEIFYSTPQDSTGGSLDVDCQCESCPNGGNENIFWPYGAAAPPSGVYTVAVNYYGACDLGSGATSAYTLRVLEGGAEVHVESGTLGDGEVFTLDVSR